jgi:hypothetical protein
MGTHQGGNGGNIPPEGGHDQSPDDSADLPELPAEWGDLTIPDDLSELADEAEEIRRELAGQHQDGVSLVRGKPGPADPEPSIGVPLLIMSVAVLITLVSLFAMAWSGSGAPEETGAGPDSSAPASLPDVSLVNAAGQQERLVQHLPIVILLVEECEDCSGLVTDTVAAAPPGVTVAAVGSSAPGPPSGLPADDPDPLRLGDPNGMLRDQLGLGAATNAATVVLVDQDNQITQRFPSVTAVSRFQADLAELAS